MLQARSATRRFINNLILIKNKKNGVLICKDSIFVNKNNECRNIINGNILNENMIIKNRYRKFEKKEEKKMINDKDIENIAERLNELPPNKAIVLLDKLSLELTTQLKETIMNIDVNNKELEKDKIIKETKKLKKSADEQYLEADQNNDNVVTKEEFTLWYSKRFGGSSIARHLENNIDDSDIIEPTREQLNALFLRVGLPFVGFGFLDNVIMILAGATIEQSIGVAFGFSTMAAAGLGNLISDVAGIGLGNAIENFSHKLGLPEPKLTIFQEKSNKVKLVRNLSGAIGIAIGCLLGMFPLLFIDSNKSNFIKIFNIIDVNGNGSLSKDELLQALERFGIEVTYDDLDLLFLTAGIDNDSEIDCEIFSTLITEWLKEMKSHREYSKTLQFLMGS
eukprot:TRINITY_DN421_c0_g1_i1.p1 TRINITY_DN421_c0_g1~~TRINITY_DN421_c0_g1_i1.p1  ORF type:complete len:394 (+),score=125.41 TRINITY_DN421_c0_g1_i1:365-1546(+)